MEHPALEGMEGGCNTAPPSSTPPQVTSALDLRLTGEDSRGIMWFVAVWLRMTPEAHILEYLVPSLWNYLEKIKRCGLGGGESLEVGFEVSKTYSISS